MKKIKISSRNKLEQFVREYLKERGSATSQEIAEYIYKNNLTTTSYMPTKMEVAYKLKRVGEEAGEKCEDIPNLWRRKHVVYKYPKSDVTP